MGILLSNENNEQIKLKGKIENIKSKYILQKVFYNLEKKKLLYILKYNKQIKNRIEIDINAYKEYSEIYSLIEIEITLAKNKYGNFINIKKEDEIYYHIYFNNLKTETKRNYIGKNEKIKIIKIIIDYQVKKFNDLFNKCNCIKSIYFKKFYRNNINNMSGTFFECSSINEINLENFKTDNVTNMSSMFSGCSSLTELNLNNFNTNNVINMSSMFYGCSSLKNLNLNNFNTNNVINMCYMFSGCSSLTELDLNNFNTNNVTNMSSMFYGCSSLKELNLISFKTDNVTNMYCMFYECSLLKELNLNNFKTNNETNMSFMFSGCSNDLKMKIKTQYKNIKKVAF